MSQSTFSHKRLKLVSIGVKLTVILKSKSPCFSCKIRREKKWKLPSLVSRKQKFSLTSMTFFLFSLAVHNLRTFLLNIINMIMGLSAIRYAAHKKRFPLASWVFKLENCFFCLWHSTDVREKNISFLNNKKVAQHEAPLCPRVDLQRSNCQ